MKLHALPRVLPVLRVGQAPELPALPAQRRHFPRRALQHRLLRVAHPHAGAAVRPRAWANSSGPAATATCISITSSRWTSNSTRVPLTLPKLNLARRPATIFDYTLRRLSDRELPASSGHQGARRGMNRAKSKQEAKANAFDQSQPTRGGPPIVTSPLVEVRNSPVHGRGVFAAAFIPKGTRIIEYLGERLSHKAADARYDDHDVNDNHTFLFIVDKHTVIDAAVRRQRRALHQSPVQGQLRVRHRASPRVHRRHARHRGRRRAGLRLRDRP